MTKNIKKIAYSAASAGLVLPALAFAQWTAPNSAGNLSNKKFSEVLTSVMNWMLSIVGILGIIGFVVAGILYITAAGNEDRISQAKSTMMWSIVGVLVALLGLIMVRTVDAIINGNSSGF